MLVEIELSENELRHITASLNNMAIDYRQWADDYIDDECIFTDYIESYRNCRILEIKFSKYLANALSERGKE